MRTTLDIDADLLAEAIRVTGAPSQSAAVRLGLEALLNQAASRRIKALRGAVPTLTAPPRRRAAVHRTR